MKKTLYTFLFVFCFAVVSVAQTTNYQVYSVFVMSIARYSSWPASNGDFKITVIGKSKVYDELLRVSQTKDVNGKKIVVTLAEDISQIGDCNIVYISDNKSSTLDEIAKKFEGKPVMIITEREGLYKKGASFSFVVIDESKLRFDINKTDLEKKQIKISQSLTGLANLVI